MNRIYKVIFNRNRNLVQVVPEYAHSNGKEVSASRHSKARGLARVLLSFLAAMMIASPGYAADGDGTTDTTTATTTYISDTNTADENIKALDTQVAKNASDISTNKSSIATNTADIATNKSSIATNKTAIDANTKNIETNTTNIATNTKNIASNKTAIDQNTTDIATNKSSIASNKTTIDANTKNIETNTTNIATNTKNIATNTSDITSLKDLSNITTAGKKVITGLSTKVNAGDRVTVKTDTDATTGQLTYTISANNDGAISIGDTNLVSGGTMYTELRPASTGTYYYISSDNSTAANLIALDSNLYKALAALDLDTTSDSTTYVSKLSKYFKVNPEITTGTDNTKTYAPDAAANGTNAVAIGPSAQAGESTTDATTSTTTVTGGTSSTAVGDSAKANGDTSVALGYNAQVLNTTDLTGATTATIKNGVAIGNGAVVNGTSDATAIGTSAKVNETAISGIAIGKGAVTGEDKGTVTVGDATGTVAAIGGANSVALGTKAIASGSEALALGNGAQVNNYTTEAGTTVTKTLSTGSAAIGDGAIVKGANNAVALGSGATVTGTGTNSDDSMALGKAATVTNATDAIAEGTSAAVADGANNGIALGNTAKANTSNTTAIGYNASATGAGAVAIGENTSTNTEGGVSIGSGTSASGKSIVIGYATDTDGTTVKTESQNLNAIAIGNGAQANTNDSVSIGHQAGMNTSQSRTSGYGSLIAIGTNAGNNVKGMQNVALGSGAGSNVKSSYNVAIGSNAGAGINYAAKDDTNPQNGYNISIGVDANYQSADANAKNIMESIAIGHSANAVSNAMALGYSTTASGDKSMALGYNATAADTDSIAIGDKASAGGGNIAVGSGSLAPAITTYGTSYLTNNTNVDGYISLGGQTSATTSKTVLRRISNVADGSADQDAVTVAQLKAAYTDLEGTIKTTDTKISDTYTQSTIDTKIANVESKITNAQTKYFSINTSSDTLTANADNSGATTEGAADAMAIGPNATATKAKAVAIGNNVLASGKGSIAIGTADNPATSTTATAGSNTSANPHVTSAEGSNSVAVGTSSIAQTDNSVAIGTRASVYTSDVTDSTTGNTVKVGKQSIAIGYQAETRNSNAISLGSDAKAYSDGSTAVGHGAYAQGADSVVVGTSSTANGSNSGILGKSNTINGSNTYAVGSENKVNGNWGAVSYSNINGSKNTITPIADTSGSTVNGMNNLSVTGNSNTINQGSYSDTVNNISILGNSNSVSGAATDSGNAGTTTNITVIGGSNTIAGRDGAGSDGYGIGTWKTLERTTVIGYGNTVNQAGNSTLSSLANTQILGNDVTATLGNSVYLGTGSAAATANLADSDTLTDAETKAADAVDKTGKTDTEIATAQAEAKAKARYAENLKAMKKSGTTAGLQTLNTDTTYGDGTSYTYAGSTPTGVVTVGSVNDERRIQNVAAGLVSATSTDAVNGSQLYALTRQLRFGGDNSTFGSTSSDDKNVIARGSAQTLAITGGGVGVTTTNTDGVTTTTVDNTKLTDNNISVIANTDTNALNIKLASDLTSLNTAQLGSGSGTDYKETIKLDGTGTNGGTLTLDDAKGTNGVTLRTSGSTTTKDLSGTAAARLVVNDKTVATMDDGLTVGGDSGTDSKLKLNSKLTIKGGINSQNAANRLNDTNNNIGVTSDGNGTLTVKLSKDIALGNYQSGTETTDKSGTLRVNGGSYYSFNNGSSISLYKSAGTADGSGKSPVSGDTLGVTMGMTKSNGGYIGLFDGSGSNARYIASGETVNGIPRIEYYTATGATYNLATLNDGTNYKDDAGNSVSVALNKTLTLSGGATTDSTNTAANWTTGNISVVSSADTTNGTANGNGTMSIRLAKNLDLSSDGSLKTGATTINNSGLTNGSTTLDGTGLTITNGPSVTTSGIKANGKIANVTAGTDNTDAANVAQIKAATTEVTAGDNVSVTNTPGADKQNVYKVSVNNLAVKANGEGTTTVALAKGLNFKNGTNTTAAVDSDGTVTINATHNKLTTVTAKAATATSDDANLTLRDADGNEVTSTGLKNTYTTVSKNGKDHTVTFARNDGVSQTLSLSDLDGASTEALTAAAAKATSVVVKGNNVDSVTDDTTSADGHHIYTVNVSDLAVKTTDGEKKSVKLSNGLVFADGDNTTATVGDNGTIKYNVSNAAIKAQAKEAIDVKSANNFATVSADTTDPSKTTFTITATHNKLTSGEVTTAATADSNAVTMTLKDADGNEVTTSGLKDTYTTITKDTEAKTVKFHRNDGTDMTLSLSDFGAASTTDMAQAAAAATTEIKAGTNASLGETKTDDTDKHKIYTLNVDNLSVSQNDSKVGTGVALKDGLSFNDGTNTTASVTADGKVSFNVSNDAIKKQAKDAVSLTAGDNVKIGAPTETDTSKTYTISVDNLKLQNNGVDAGTRKLAEGLNFANGTNTTASVVDGKITYGLNDSISLTKVTTGSSSLDTNGLTITNGPSVLASGIDAGKKAITNVASGGDTDTNAANISDVKRLVNAASSTTATTGFQVKGDDTTAQTVQLGKQLNVTGGATTDLTDGNVGVTTAADAQGNATLSVKLKKDIDLGATGSVKTGATTMDTTGITNGNMSLGATGLTLANGTKFTSNGISAGNQQIKGVAAGTETTDAVNKGQLDALQTQVNNASWTIEDADHTDNAQTVKNGDTVALKAGDNLSLSQDGKKFTYSLNKVVTGMTSVTAVDDKQNTSVLNGEGLKVTDAQGNALTQHATEVRLHDANKAATDTTTDVVLNKQGLQNGGHTITGVADGKVVAGSQEAVNGSQLYALQQKVGSGWKITGNNTASTTSIGADKTVSFVDGKNSTVTVSGSDSGATVKVDVDTATLAVKDSKAVATGSGVADASQVAEAINNAAWTVEKAGSEAQAQQVKAGMTVTFGNDENLTLAQNGTAFTYGLASNVNISTIRLGGTKGADGVWTGGIYIGKQVGGGANPNDGNYITGLDNTSWDLSKVVDDRVATEGQLKAAINQVTIASQSGGFGLRDESGNTVTQMLGQTVSVVGDTEYEADGKTVKQQGNITTEADSTNVGGIKVKLNKDINLTDQGSVTIGQSSVTSGKVVLGSDADATKKITLDSSKGTATVGGVTVDGVNRTVTGLSNTTWNGTAVSGRAATEDQLAAAISQATTTAQDNELHVKGGSYNIQTTTDAKGQKQNSVTLSVVDGKGTQKDTVVINDVAKASDLGDTAKLANDIKNKNDNPTSVVDAVNNLNDKVGNNQYLDVKGKEIQNGDSSTTAIGKLNNRMNDIYSTATKHNTVNKADDNVTIETTPNDEGGTEYKIGLNKEKIDLGKVTIQGNEGSITAKSVTADTFTSGNTTVTTDGVKIGNKSELTSDTLKVDGKTYVSGDGINANSQRITNVANGTADGDAVNVKQVNDLAAAQGAAINQNARAINNLGREVDKLDSRIDRVGAGAAALAALNPGPYDPNDKVDFSAGYGNYRGASAAAVGMYYHPDERTIMSLGVAMGGGENMVNAGVTWKLGRRTPVRPQAVPVAGAVSTTPAIPVKTAVPVAAVKPAVVQPEVRPVAAQPAVVQQTVARPAVTSLQNAAATNAQLMDLLARQTAILERLSEQKTVPAAAPVAKGDDLFPDVPENHWAYSFVGKLAQAGVLKGTPVAQAAENPLLTRNDFAQILYASLKNGATTNPALNQDGSLNKLASEFKAELKNVKK